MKRLLLTFGFFVAICPLIFGQPAGLIYTDAQLEIKKTNFKERSHPLIEAMQASRIRAKEIAEERGWLIEDIMPTGEVISLQGVDSQGMPIYYKTELNSRAAATTSTNRLWPGGRSGLNLSGSSSFLAGKIGIWDGGSVLATHQELINRIQIHDHDAAISSHATHVAGTMISAGINPFSRGMAFGAPNLRSWDFNNDGAEMSAAASSLILSNHSYGRVTGWNLNTSRAGTASDPQWEWRGNINVSTTEDYNFGYYDDRAQLWDMIAYHSPYYLIVKSAGNNRNVNGPAPGQPFWRFNTVGSWELVPQRPADMSNNDGYDIISTYGTAKNILTIGAVAGIEDGYRRIPDVVMSTFSSWGPTDDGRIKPDLVANGVSLYSSASASNTSYSTSSGTSMSAPNTTGSLILLQEHYHLLHNRFMLSSTLKALACHTADEAGNPGPDYVFGWGLLNTERAALTITYNGSQSHIEEIQLNSGASIVRTVVASGAEPLRITIAWTDPEAQPLPIDQAVLNNRTPRLINDLDLRVSDGANSFLPWVLNPNNPMSFATRADNVLDNIEQVVITNPVPGRTYTITISHKNQTLARGSQVVSLIATGVGGQPHCNSIASTNAGSRIDAVQMHTISNNTASGCQTYRDFTSTVARVNRGASYNFTINTGTCGDENPRIIKIFADWNSNGIFETGELVAVSGIITTSGSFTGTLTVPNEVIIGSTALMRVVLTETSNPDEVLPCGPYQRGETQDYLLAFERAQFDIGPVALLDLGSNVCAAPNNNLHVRLENFGTNAVLDFGVLAEIFSQELLLSATTETFTGAMSSLTSTGFLFNQTFATQPDTEYTIRISTLLEGDLNPSNNSISVTFRTRANVEAPLAQAIQCTGDNHLNLSSQANGHTYWYNLPENGRLLAFGNQTTLSFVPTSGRVFAFANFLSGRVGPRNRHEEPWTGGGYSNFSAQTFFTADVPLVIVSARLHVGVSGEVTFSIEDFNTGEIVSLARLFVTSTIDNQGNDNGRVFPLNLLVPRAGSYRMRYTFGPNTTLFRANAQSSNPYPYGIPGIISITGTNQTNSTGFYYYLYDMQLSAPGCASAPAEIVVQSQPKPVVNLEEKLRLENGLYIIDAGNPGSTYLWSTGETSRTIMPQAPGVFTVSVTNQWGCRTISSIHLTVTSISDPSNLNARVFPNPASSNLNIESPVPVRVELFNISGQRIFFSERAVTRETLNVSSFNPGIYFIRLTDPATSIPSIFRVIVN